MEEWKDGQDFKKVSLLILRLDFCGNLSKYKSKHIFLINRNECI